MVLDGFRLRLMKPKRSVNGFNLEKKSFVKIELKPPWYFCGHSFFLHVELLVPWSTNSEIFLVPVIMVQIIFFLKIQTQIETQDLISKIEPLMKPLKLSEAIMDFYSLTKPDFFKKLNNMYTQRESWVSAKILPEDNLQTLMLLHY